MTRTVFGLAMMLGGFIALQWHDANVERRIAEHDRQPPRYECTEQIEPRPAVTRSFHA